MKIRNKVIQDIEQKLAAVESLREVLRHDGLINRYDQIIWPEGVECTTETFFVFGQAAYIQAWFVVPSFKELMPALEAIEEMTGFEFQSRDDESNGNRVFEIEKGPLRISLYVTPRDSGEVGTCRKIVVGMDRNTVTTETPRYRIICD